MDLATLRVYLENPTGRLLGVGSVPLAPLYRGSFRPEGAVEWEAPPGYRALFVLVVGGHEVSALEAPSEWGRVGPEDVVTW